MVKFHDIKQNSDDWYSLRAGKLTGSKFSTIMANYGKSFGEPAKKYAVNVAIEQITGKPISSDYTNSHMERGHEQEPIARDLYEQEYFVDVSNGGFFESGFVGVSPDGVIADGGIIEIKSVIASVHFANIKRGYIDPAYKWQVIGNLKYTDSDYIDFISFCVDFPVDKQLYVCRVKKEMCAEEFKMIDERVEQFQELVESTKEVILNSEYGVF